MFIGLATKAYLSIKRKRLRNSTFPRDIVFFVTSRCNSACEHCFYRNAINNVELSNREIASVIKSFPKLNSICLTGGEPTIRGNVSEIIEMSLAKAKMVTLCTNAKLSRTVRKIAENFLSKKRNLIFQISIDGTEAIHDTIRGRGSYKASVESIGILRSMGYRIITVLTLSKLNHLTNAEVETVYENLAGIASEVRINILREARRSVWGLPKDKTNWQHSPVNDDLGLTMDDLRGFQSQLLKLDSKYQIWSQHNRELFSKTLCILGNKTKLLECFAGRAEAVIYQDGSVSLCEFYKPFLNLIEYNFDFKSAWSSDVRKENLAFIKKCCCVHSCNLSSAISLSDDFFLNSIRSQGLKPCIIGKLRSKLP